jgi:hypothetical protein
MLCNINDIIAKPNSVCNFYVIDFLNIFSDYREIVYKQKNIDFHMVKHDNKEKDTISFFYIFFTKYIQKVNIKVNSEFIFILKKINNYTHILNKILEYYSAFKIRFILIEDEYDNKKIDKNKDDFLCQYLFFHLFKQYNNCILISNDKYRDKYDYIKLFNFDINLKIIYTEQENNKKVVRSKNVTINLNKNIINLMITKKCIRCTIPKNKLNQIL